MRLTRCCLPLALAAVLTLVGCGRSSAPPPASPVGSAAEVASTPSAAPGTAASPAIAASSAVPGDHARTKRYRIDISYPSLGSSDSVLSKALHKAGDEAKHEFMQGLPNPDKHPEYADRQMQLKVDFSVASRMPRFVSVREKGMADTGGAHPVPIDRSFVYDTRSQRVIGLDDLFAKPEKARKHLAKRARRQLEQKLLAKVPGGKSTTAKARREWKKNMREMIQGGTKPTAKNFSEFVILAGAGDQASGLQLIFPPYHVAPYSYGTQTVDVPVDAFAGELASGYRDAFDLSGSTK